MSASSRAGRVAPRRSFLSASSAHSNLSKEQRSAGTTTWYAPSSYSSPQMPQIANAAHSRRRLMRVRVDFSQRSALPQAGVGRSRRGCPSCRCKRRVSRGVVHGGGNMDERSGTVRLVESRPDAEVRGLVATVSRHEVEEVLRADEGPVDLLFD